MGLRGLGARRTVVGLCLLVWWGIGLAAEGGATKPSAQSSLEITPEELRAVIAAQEPYILVDAGEIGAKSPPGAHVRFIYYTRSPSFRAAQVVALRDRNASTDAGRLRQLIGTPEEWSRLGLPQLLSVLPAQPIKIAPHELSETIADEVGLQVLDARAVHGPENVESLRSSFWKHAV